MSARTDHVPLCHRAETVDDSDVSVADDAQRCDAAVAVASIVYFPPERWLREPLIHFLLIGVVLFAADRYMQPGSGGGRVVESRFNYLVDELTQLVMLFQVTMAARSRRRRNSIAWWKIKCRRRFFIARDWRWGWIRTIPLSSAAWRRSCSSWPRMWPLRANRTAAELKAWFEKNKAKFALPSRVSFRHLYFSPDRRGQRARDDAAKALAKLAGQPQDAKMAGSLADPFMFQDFYRDRVPDYFGKEFGPQFAQAVAKLPPGSWQGPIESGFGWHLVFVDTVIPGRVSGLRGDRARREDCMARRAEGSGVGEGLQGDAGEVHCAAARAA